MSVIGLPKSESAIEGFERGAKQNGRCENEDISRGEFRMPTTFAKMVVDSPISYFRQKTPTVASQKNILICGHNWPSDHEIGQASSPFDGLIDTLIKAFEFDPEKAEQQFAI